MKLLKLLFTTLPSQSLSLSGRLLYPEQLKLQVQLLLLLEHIVLPALPMQFIVH